jgi:hypothetical protein
MQGQVAAAAIKSDHLAMPTSAAKFRDISEPARLD